MELVMPMDRLVIAEGPRRPRICIRVRALTSEQCIVGLEEGVGPSVEGQRSSVEGLLRGTDHT